ncbi:MAG: DEAD/DEAH box helicase [Pirellulaceae bacterium]
MAAKKKPALKPEGTLRFEDLELSEVTLEALRVAGYEEPTTIQAGMIPKAIEGIDLVGQARTGTGKTAAFAIPIIEVLESHQGKSPRALILVPTRELAVQVRGEVVKLSHGRRLNCVAVYGGKPIREQIEKLRRGADVIVGTPGRVLDHMSRRTLDLSELEIVVLDEADRMLDIGFRPDIEKILRQCPSDRQTLLLSATVPPPIERMAQRYMHEPETLNFSPTDISVETIEQSYFTVEHGRKFELLVRLLAREKPRQAIVFCRTKRRTESLFRRLSKHVDSPACIHGDMAQSSRDRVMERFRAGKIRCLIATDVVGRGIDVTNISHIINFDTPQFCDDYVHRVGRTGRMGREGIAFTFVAPEEGPELTRIEQRINRQLKRDELSGFDATPDGSPLLNHGDLSDETPQDTATATAPPAPFGRRGRRHRRAL